MNNLLLICLGLTSNFLTAEINSPKQGVNQCSFYALGNALESVLAQKNNRAYNKDSAEFFSKNLGKLARQTSYNGYSVGNIFSVSEIMDMLYALQAAGTCDSIINRFIKLYNELKDNIVVIQIDDRHLLDIPKKGAVIYCDGSHFTCFDIDKNRSEKPIILRDSLYSSSKNNMSQYLEKKLTISPGVSVLKVKKILEQPKVTISKPLFDYQDVFEEKRKIREKIILSEALAKKNSVKLQRGKLSRNFNLKKYFQWCAR